MISLKSLSTLVAVVFLAFRESGGDPAAAAEGSRFDPGASPFKAIKPDLPLIAGFYRFIGVKFRGDADPQVLDYSRILASTARSLEGAWQGELTVREIDGRP